MLKYNESVQVGVAFELHFPQSLKSGQPSHYAEVLIGRIVKDVRDLREDVRQMIAAAGLMLGCGGSHIYINRQADISAFEDAVTHGRDASALHIPRWAFIGESETAKSWARDAYNSRFNTWKL